MLRPHQYGNGLVIGQTEGSLQGFGQAWPAVRAQHQPINDRLDAVLAFFVQAGYFVQFKHLAIHPGADQAPGA